MSKVLVALSGGIDSSVAAALLKKQGYDLIGVHLKFWYEEENLNQPRALRPHGAPIGNKCCTVESTEKARAVAEQLGFPFYVLNFKNVFKEKVVDYFLRSSEHETPNPCIRCNREIKFGHLLKKMRELECDFVATGHYARITQDESYHLLKGLDPEKDQSYFLHQLTQEKLQHILFPVGGYTKKQVWKLAKDFGLNPVEITRGQPPTESMDVCFYPEKTPNEFLKRHLKNMRSGQIKHVAGTVFKEEHEGLPLYTIGQRKGIKIGGLKDPLYVVKLDFKNNALVVGPDKSLFTAELEATDLTFVSGEVPQEDFEAEVKIRYRSEGVPAIIETSRGLHGRRKGIVKIHFAQKVRAVTPGQSVVFYKGEEVLGGGIITL